MDFNIKRQNIENVFPLWRFEQGFLISKTADITCCFEITLPQVYTQSTDEYDTLHKAFVSAIRELPDYTIVHKQDIFSSATVQGDNPEQSFLSSAYQKHFEGRSYLKHQAFLYITLSSKSRMDCRATASALCRNTLIPNEQLDENRMNQFKEAIARLTQILKDAEVSIRPLSEEELLGTQESFGWIEKYLSLDYSNHSTVLKDLHIEDGCLMIGDQYVSCFSIADLDIVPAEVANYSYNKKLSNPPSFFLPQSFVANLALNMPFEHIYNQYFFLDNNKENLKRIQQKGKLQQAFSSASRENAINLEKNTEFLDEAYHEQKRTVRCAFNILIWDRNWETLLNKNSIAEAALSGINCCTKGKIEKIVPQLFWGGIPGAASQYPSELSFLTFIEQGCCFLNFDTNYRDMVNHQHFGIYLTDRISGIPIRIDLDDYPKKKGWIDNRNKVIIGPSGSGKSFFTNNLVRQYWEQGCHIVLVDIGDSYQGLCQMIQEETNGEDGVYYTYTDTSPLSFNPFYEPNYEYSEEKKEQLLTLIKTLWKGDNPISNSESIHIKVCIYNYIDKICENRSIKPCFNTFYRYLITDFKPYVTEQMKIRLENFDVDDMIQVLKPFSHGGMFEHLLNSDRDMDLLNKRFIVFELDNIKDNKTLFPIVTLIIMATFMDKIRRLPSDQRKFMLIEEAWQAIAKEGMASFIGYLYRTARKHFGEIAIVTQEPDDLVGNKFIKDIMITQSHCKILLDLRDFKEKAQTIQEILSLSQKEQNILFSVNNGLDYTHRSKYKEVFISLRNYCAVYGVEVSKEEYCTFTTDKEEKGHIQSLRTENNGSIQQAIKTYIKDYMK
ncbi:MAG: TraG family conjugative transposon ATPase [Bacteroidales bacterium]|nr:TraG family conjugative transposon ATPase [Bacteroidales bacterium]